MRQIVLILALRRWSADTRNPGKLLTDPVIAAVEPLNPPEAGTTYQSLSVRPCTTHVSADSRSSQPSPFVAHRRSRYTAHRVRRALTSRSKL